jgi:hypothetical protein
MLIKKTSKNQMTLPKDIANAFPDAQSFDVQIEDNKILLMPVKIPPVGSNLESVRGKMKKFGITKKEVAEAVQWARSRKK